MQILAALLMVIAFCAGVFLFIVQPIWSIVDVAISKKLSGAGKAVIIVLTMVLLGPIMTFFYALIGAQSSGLRKSTLISAVVLAISCAGVIGVAALMPPDETIDIPATNAAAAMIDDFMIEAGDAVNGVVVVEDGEGE